MSNASKFYLVLAMTHYELWVLSLTTAKAGANLFGVTESKASDSPILKV